MKIKWIVLGMMLVITAYSFANNRGEDGSATVCPEGDYISFSLRDSTDYTQKAPKAVSIKAENFIILSNGFHFKAAEGNSLVTQLAPPTNSRSNHSDTFSLTNDPGKYEILQLQQGSLTIRYTAGEPSDHLDRGSFEIVNLNTGQVDTKGKLSSYETQVDITELENGFYVVKLAGKKWVQTKKIIVRN